VTGYTARTVMTLLLLMICVAPCMGSDADDLANCILGDDYIRITHMLTRDPSLANVQGKGGWRPLHYAAIMNRKRVMLLLLKSGADVNARDDEMWTPLHMAAHQGCEETALLLISRDAELDPRDRDGWTPLHCALNSLNDRGFTTIARALIDRGADINAKTAEGKTPLSLALERGRVELASLLRRKGAGE